MSLAPVPDVDAPLSMTTRWLLWDIDITVCPVVDTSNRFSDGVAFLIAGDASLRILRIDRRGDRVGDDAWLLTGGVMLIISASYLRRVAG